MKATAKKSNPFALGTFSLTLFLSAALMFAIEPMMGKMLLPLAGGTPAGWIVAMAFFQMMLLLGYFYAHMLSRFTPRVHALMYIAVLVAGMACLPIKMPAAETIGNPGPFQVFALLTVAAAVPFIALSATSSTLQRLFTTAGHAASGDPYFLYAASNLGSFAGLLLYPFAFEPAFGLAEQARYWFYAFGALTIFCVLCLALTYQAAGKKVAKTRAKSKITNQRRLRWIALAFFPSSLLLGVTTHISTDLFSAPMVWVPPLAIYLLTFVIAFSRKPLVKMRTMSTLQPLAVSLVIALLLSFDADLRVSWYAVAFHFLAFGSVALMCHMQLAAERPIGDDRGLTEFYLMMSVGGALGGLLNAFIIPVISDRLIEYPLMMILSCLMNPGFAPRMAKPAKDFMVIGLACVGGYVIYRIAGLDFIYGTVAGGYTNGMTIADVIVFVTSIILATHPRTVFYGALVLLMTTQFIVPRDVKLTERNFYGVVKVFDRPQEADGKIYDIRFLVHGVTTHGIQVRDPKFERTTTSYFWKEGPAGNVFDVYAPKKIAVIGLGAGTMNCYSNPSNEFTFLEIDPAVVKIASDPDLFTFLSACKAKRPPNIIIGDGRLKLAQLKDKFDLITLDAFSSDAIPTHLITLEALKVYLDHLNPNGIVLLHISNRFFNLSKVLAVNAQALGLKSHGVLEVPPDRAFYAAPSEWFVMTRKNVSLAPLEAYGWHEVTPEKDRRPWTDDYTNPLSTLIFTGFMGPTG